MTETRSIARHVPDRENLDFDALKNAGIQFIEALCGKTWTDYNLHDPGITILEALCYALTELIYRTEFAPADYLTGPHGAINFEHQALYRPHDIFPSQPITISDYRTILFDAIPELDNVWLRIDAEAPLQGLYHIQVLLGEAWHAGEQAAASEAVLAQIRHVYAAHRNLCEDLDQVRLVTPSYYRLCGTVQIDGQREPDEILAALYVQGATALTPGIRFTSFAEMVLTGKSLEEIFTGPLTQHVYLDEGAFESTPQVVTIADLIGLMRTLEGVREIANLWFEDETGTRVEELPSHGAVPRLRFPTRDQDIGVQLYRNTRACPVTLKAVQDAWARLHSRYHAMRHVPQDFDAIDALPKGVRRPFAEYASLQHDFPDIYGINAYGIPEAAAPARQAQAKQLKAYLLLFEQLIANSLGNIQRLAQLFSLDEDLSQTYFAQCLRHPNVPNVDGLYQDDLEQVSTQLGDVAARYDNFSERRNRLLDYLLALYGETFTQNSLRRFRSYQTTDHALAQYIIHNKIQFLREIVTLSQQRARAFHTQDVAWDTQNTSVLHKKVSILLGLPSARTRSLSDVLRRHGLEIMDDEQCERLRVGTVEVAFVHLGDLEDHTRQPGPAPAADTYTREETRSLLAEMPLFTNGVISASILRNGIDLERYRIGRTGEGQRFQLLFKPDERFRWWSLASYDTADEARRAAVRVRRCFLELNVESEGLHVVEHLLLRPTGPEANQPETLADFYNVAMPLPPADFHSFRLSVLFPAWSARFHDREFQKLAEETVRLNCPAHIEAECYWLDFPSMCLFEERFKAWLEARRGTDVAALNAAAQHVMGFLLAHRP